MRKQARRAAAIAALALALSAGSASAHTAVFPNSLVFEAGATGPTTAAYSGEVASRTTFCYSNRLVDIYVGGVFLKHVRTDYRGHFSTTGPLPPPGTEATAVIKRLTRKYGRGKHKHTCSQKAETKKVSL